MPGEVPSSFGQWSRLAHRRLNSEHDSQRLDWYLRDIARLHEARWTTGVIIWRPSYLNAVAVFANHFYDFEYDIHAEAPHQLKMTVYEMHFPVRLFIEDQVPNIDVSVRWGEYGGLRWYSNGDPSAYEALTEFVARIRPIIFPE